jgi:hypothetical protein
LADEDPVVGGHILSPGIAAAQSISRISHQNFTTKEIKSMALSICYVPQANSCHIGGYQAAAEIRIARQLARALLSWLRYSDLTA